VKAVHVWRERRASFGELVMQDSSPFRWLEDRGPACHLIALIDDASSRIWGRFTEHDTPEENLGTLQGWLRRYGRQLGREHRLGEILSVRAARRVAEDHTVSWDGNRWGGVREEICAGLRGAAVEIERRLDGSHWLRYRGRYVHLRPCPEPTRTSASPSDLRPPELAEQTPRPKNKLKPQYHVPANHPWRRPWKRTFLLCIDNC
jgi:hypothetical protein